MRLQLGTKAKLDYKIDIELFSSLVLSSMSLLFLVIYFSLINGIGLIYKCYTVSVVFELWKTTSSFITLRP